MPPPTPSAHVAPVNCGVATPYLTGAECVTYPKCPRCPGKHGYGKSVCRFHMRFSALHITAGAHCTHRNRYHASDTTVPCMRTQNVRCFPKSGSCTSACTVSNHSARGAPPPLWRPRVLPQRPQITAQPLPCTLGAAPAAVVRAEARFHTATGSERRCRPQTRSCSPSRWPRPQRSCSGCRQACLRTHCRPQRA